MGWQDIVGGALAGGATGDPFAWSRNKLEQAFRQFQMQMMTDEVEMQREMHGIEKQKLDILLKQKQREEELENHPVSGILAALGHKVPEGAENVTVGQAKYAAPIAQIFQKEQDEFAPIPGTTALFGKKSGKVKETGLEGKPEKPVNVPAWADAMGLAKMGAKYHTAKGQQEFADYLATPQGQQEAASFQTEYAKRNTVPGVTYLQTNEGIVPMPNKGPNVPPLGQPTGFGKPIPAAAAEKLAGLQALKNDLQSIKELFKMDTPQENIGWVGPIAGRIGGIEEKYTGTASDEQVQFYAYVRDAKDALLRARSGAQINEQEYKRLVAFLPDETSPAPTFKSRVKRFEKELDNVIATKTEALSQGGYGAQQGGKTSIPKRKQGETIDDYKKRTGL